MIKPTVGRQVWYWELGPNISRQPEAATVTYVWGDTMVNLQVINHEGMARAELSVPLWQGDGNGPYWRCCEWMPYQKGQAAKTEEAERKSQESQDTPSPK